MTELHFLKNTYLFFLERGEGRENEREGNIDVREKHQFAALHMHLDQGLNLKPRHVP